MLLDLMRAVALTSDYVESLPDASGDLTLSSFRGRMGAEIIHVGEGFQPALLEVNLGFDDYEL